ncbi:gas vesicle protein GvpG [Bradyrhizobium sp. USDA 10063]
MSCCCRSRRLASRCGPSTGWSTPLPNSIAAPAAIRRELAELSRQLDEGLIDAEEFDRREDEILDRLDEGRKRGMIA